MSMSLDQPVEYQGPELQDITEACAIAPTKEVSKSSGLERSSEIPMSTIPSPGEVQSSVPRLVQLTHRPTPPSKCNQSFISGHTKSLVLTSPILPGKTLTPFYLGPQARLPYRGLYHYTLSPPPPSNTTNHFVDHVIPGDLHPTQCQWYNCYVQFDGARELHDHVISSHLPKISDDPLLCRWKDCRLHSKAFTAPSYLARHLRYHSRWWPYRCPKCRCIYAAKKILDEHLIKAHGDPDQPSLPKGDISKKINSSKEKELQNHGKRKTPPTSDVPIKDVSKPARPPKSKPWICTPPDGCGNSFGYMWNLIRHQNTCRIHKANHAKLGPPSHGEDREKAIHDNE
ncbi:hypothetical protein BJ684DRAFT_15247 [Piptocephalis cylindrospora]|uniref:C2H2-type domain-containing protein n=1 Tax=Piptocephalis cylindrospora TaxID=1907219 RepID=A0A4P9Y5Z6_9FUNG|nr:hypothetical protein BJ684DRAFT_15247 [Piptocephalis cylindrospora]|eukprot:RKP14427.1 hypothetical protein BJ684DRAFT_15247 [Piptocephalis cylindrospora]